MSNKGKYYMTSYLQMRSPDTKEQKAMTFISRLEQTSMVRKFRRKQKQQESRLSSLTVQSKMTKQKEMYLEAMTSVHS